jgi:hypothetical protein
VIEDPPRGETGERKGSDASYVTLVDANNDAGLLFALGCHGVEGVVVELFLTDEAEWCGVGI